MKKLLDLYIIRRSDGICLYHFPFGSIQLDPQLISGFITAIITFIDEVVAQGGPLNVGKSVFDTFSRGAYTVMIENGEKISGALMSLSEDPDLRARLKTCIKAFEEHYKQKILDVYVEPEMFKDFDEYVEKTFATRLVEPFSIPRIVRPVSKVKIQNPLTDLIVGFIDGNKNVFEISLESKIPLDLVAQTVLLLVKEGIVEVTFKCRETDLLKTTKLGDAALEMREVKTPRDLDQITTLKIISKIDGQKTVKELLNELNMSFEHFSKYVTYLYEHAYIEYVPIHHLACRVTMDYTNFLLEATAKYLKEDKAVKLFEETRQYFTKRRNIFEFMFLTNNKVNFDTVWRIFIASDIMGEHLLISSLTSFNYMLVSKIKQETNEKTCQKILEETNEKVVSKYGLNYEDALIMVDLNVKGERLGAMRIFLD